MKIGMFDSGMGGTTILFETKKVLPEAEYFYIADSKNCPYGEKTDAELYKVVRANVERLCEWGAETVVVACNTATVRCIARLRAEYPSVRFVGTEPAIKLAAETDAKKILVLATPGTVAAERTGLLISENRREGQEILLLPCPGLADTIERTLEFEKYMTGPFRGEEEVFLAKPLTEVEERAVGVKLEEILAGVEFEPEVVVLGCTHYPLILENLEKFFPAAKFLHGGEGVARRVRELVFMQ